MVERILDFLAGPVVRAQQVRIARAARTVRASQHAEHRIDRLADAYRAAERVRRAHR